MVSVEIEQRLALIRVDYGRVAGKPSTPYFCPIFAR
jgi:hypothetical protein